MKAVIYGGGNIGRGFIGQLFFQSSYDVTFIDINTELIDLINAQKKYPVKFSDIDDSKENEIWSENVSAINGNDRESVSEAIRGADLMAASVGVNVMKYIFGPIIYGKYKSIIDDKIGFAEASVGRMVSVQTDEMKGGNCLRIVTESFCNLPVDAAALRGAFQYLPRI